MLWAPAVHQHKPTFGAPVMGKTDSKAFFFASFLMFVFTLVSNLAAQTYWTGNAPDDDFHSAANWSSGVPGINEEAIFDLAGDYQIILDTNTAIGNLTFQFGEPELGTTTYNPTLSVDEQIYVADGASIEIQEMAVSANRLRIHGDALTDTEFKLSDAWIDVSIANIGSRMLITDASVMTANLLDINTESDSDALLQFDYGATEVITLSVSSLPDYTAKIWLREDSIFRVLGTGSMSNDCELSVTDGSVATFILGLEMTGNSLLNLDNGILLTGSPIILGMENSQSPEINVSGISQIFGNLSTGINAAPTVNIAGTLNAENIFLGIGSNLNFQDGILNVISLQTLGEIEFVSGVNSMTGDVALRPSARLKITHPGIVEIDGLVEHEGVEISAVAGSQLTFRGDVMATGPFLGDGELVFQDLFIPGRSSSVRIEMENDVRFDVSSEIIMQIEGVRGGVDYDQIHIEKTALLAGQLNLDIAADFLVGDVFTLIEIDGVATGNFLGLADGTVVTDASGTHELVIVYDAGDGNDVALIALDSTYLPGDVNLDGEFDLLDVTPFIDLISTGTFQIEADINRDGRVDLLDVDPFVQLLAGN